MPSIGIQNLYGLCCFLSIVQVYTKEHEMGRIDLFRVTANNFWEIQANLASDQRYAKDLFAYLPEGKWPKEFGKFINFLKEQPITDGWLKSNPTCAKFSTLNQQSLVFGERVLDMGKNIRKVMIGEANPLWISRMKSGTYTITPVLRALWARLWEGEAYERAANNMRGHFSRAKTSDKKRGRHSQDPSKKEKAEEHRKG